MSEKTPQQATTEDDEEERGVCMNCGADMDYNPMHPWCPNCDEEDEEES